MRFIQIEWEEKRKFEERKRKLSSMMKWNFKYQKKFYLLNFAPKEQIDYLSYIEIDNQDYIFLITPTFRTVNFILFIL